MTESVRDADRLIDSALAVALTLTARRYDQQSGRVKNMTKHVVQNRQLEFINGGWCMHDEASPYVVVSDFFFLFLFLLFIGEFSF